MLSDGAQLEALLDVVRVRLRKVAILFREQPKIVNDVLRLRYAVLDGMDLCGQRGFDEEALPPPAIVKACQDLEVFHGHHLGVVELLTANRLQAPRRPQRTLGGGCG